MYKSVICPQQLNADDQKAYLPNPKVLRNNIGIICNIGSSNGYPSCSSAVYHFPAKHERKIFV